MTDDQVLSRGKKILLGHIRNKNAFWQFPHFPVRNATEHAEFLEAIEEHHELVEKLSLVNALEFFTYTRLRTLEVLIGCKLLKEVKFVDSNLEDAHAIMIKAFLNTSPTLVSIDISGNKFSTEGIKRIMKGVERNKMLRSFSLCYQPITTDGIRHISNALVFNKALESLYLNHTGFDKNAEKILFDGVKMNTSLRRVQYAHIETKDTQMVEKIKLNQLEWRENFLKDLDSEETGKWNRSKLMFIGQGRAGKTSTVNRLLNKGFDASQDSTVGATVNQTQTSTTDNQHWRTILETDPEYLGKGMAGEQAGRLVAARKVVNREDEEKKKKAAEIRKNARNKGKPVIVEKIKVVPKAAPKIELSKEALELMKEKQKAEQEEQDRIMAEELQNGIDRENAMRDGMGELSMFGKKKEKNHRDKLEEEAARRYADAVFNTARAGKDSITFSLWDYGGQAVFYALHHLFLTKYGIYILCVNMQEILKHEDVSKEYLSFWLNSVKLHAPTAPVLLVGTHLDALKNESDVQFVDNFFVKNFKEKYPQIECKIPGKLFYPVDNKNNTGVPLLRFDIERISREQTFVTADVSVKWMFCLDKMMVKRDAGGKAPAWLKLSSVKGIAKGVNMDADADLEKMLVLFHELGVLVRLTGTEELRNLVTLDPQWLLDGLCKVIRDERLHGPSEAELVKVGLTSEMKLLYEKGLASLDVMRYLWDSDEFRDHFNYLLDLMKYMVLISDWDFRDEKMFVIPSLLIPRPEDDDLFQNPEDHKDIKKFIEDKKREDGKVVKKIEIREEVKVTNYAVFDFSKVFLPMGVFQRLVCLCVSYSTSINTEKGKVSEPNLFARWAKIWMGNGTILYLEQKENKIFLSVEDPKTAPTCYKAVNSMLEKLNGDLMGRGLQWEKSFLQTEKTIKQKEGEQPIVSEVSIYEEKEKVAVKKFLAPWFEKEKVKEKMKELVDLENFVDDF